MRVCYKLQFLYKPSEQEVFDPAQTTAAPLFPPPRQQTPIACFGSHSKYHMFLNPSFRNEHLLMTSLLLLISRYCGKPRSHPLCPPRGSWSLPRAGSSLTDSFLVWWGGGAIWIGALLCIDFSLVQSIPVTCTSIEAYKTPFQTNKGSLACRNERCPLASCLHCALSSFSVYTSSV